MARSKLPSNAQIHPNGRAIIPVQVRRAVRVAGPTRHRHPRSKTFNLAEFVNPPLTTASMSQAEIARAATRALLCRIEQVSPAATTKQRITTTLVVRETTARPGCATAAHSRAVPSARAAGAC